MNYSYGWPTFKYWPEGTNGSFVCGIANNVTIMSGVWIGDCSVIACNNHVIKDVEPYSIVGGNPAKFIKYRFSKK